MFRDIKKNLMPYNMALNLVRFAHWTLRSLDASPASWLAPVSSTLDPHEYGPS